VAIPSFWPTWGNALCLAQNWLGNSDPGVRYQRIPQGCHERLLIERSGPEVVVQGVRSHGPLPCKNDKLWEDEIAHEISILDMSVLYEMDSKPDSGDIEGLTIEELTSLMAEGVENSRVLSRMPANVFRWCVTGGAHVWLLYITQCWTGT
jgi:hypothetical protein